MKPGPMRRLRRLPLVALRTSALRRLQGHLWAVTPLERVCQAELLQDPDLRRPHLLGDPSPRGLDVLVLHLGGEDWVACGGVEINTHRGAASRAARLGASVEALGQSLVPALHAVVYPAFAWQVDAR